jgi:hypothetical protein
MLILKCGCGVFHPINDYPFVSCKTCGYINCGTKEELEEAEKNGTKMQVVKWSELTDKEKALIDEMDKQFEEDQFEAEEEMYRQLEGSYWKD